MNQTASCDLRQPRNFFMGITADNLTSSDYALARAAAGGTAAAIGVLYDRYSRRVYSLCFRMTHNAADAEDLTQEVFILLLRKIGSFRGESQFNTWLYRLTVNHVLMYFRRVTSRKEAIIEDVEAEISTSRRSKHSARLQVMDKIALDEALAQLPPGSRSVLVLFDIEGYSHREIAGILGCSIGNSKSQLHKARMKLGRLLN
ncbi:MAG TPA: sigma-70 family RNA polymerase sigma factor [Pyrinomonadaceae bacterium]